jgi:hypothetical protein
VDGRESSEVTYLGLPSQQAGQSAWDMAKKAPGHARFQAVSRLNYRVDRCPCPGVKQLAPYSSPIHAISTTNIVLRCHT